MKKYLIPFALSILISCAEKPVETIPEDVLSQEKMTAIMVDVQLIEGGIVIRKYNKNQRQDQITQYYKALFKKHGTSKEEFENSLGYYTDHPDKLEAIYDGMLEHLSEIQAKVETEKEE